MVTRVYLILIAACAICVGLIAQHEWHAPWHMLFADPMSLALPDMIFQSSTLPRLAMAFLAGGTLGMVTILLQQLTHNPLAADSTLALSSGAQLSLLVASIFMPQLYLHGGTWIAFVGAAASLCLVLALSIDKEGLLPIRVILAGLMVGFYLGAISTILILLFTEESRSVLSWGGGSLAQDSWHDVLTLLQRLALSVLALLFLLRPLSMMGLGDGTAKSLGVPLTWIRLATVVLIAYLCASVVSLVGMMGFIGLAAAAMVHQLGVRRLSMRLLAAFSLGGLLLLLTDGVLFLLKYATQIDLPTGSVTSLIGAPVLLWMIYQAMPVQLHVAQRAFSRPRSFSRTRLVLLGLGLLVSVWVSLLVTRGMTGWQLSFDAVLIDLRYPRLLVALAAGLMLSIAGVLLQRLTQNPMASPELLGISSGTAMGVLLATIFSITAPVMLWGVGIASALTTLLVITLINHKNRMQPEKILLTGMAIAAFFESITRLFLASGDARVQAVLAWLAGSTYQATPLLASSMTILAVVLFVGSWLLYRWLGLLDLSATVAQALGLNLTLSRYVLIIFSALLTALATLLMGPLSFIGLLAPHLARALGFHKPLLQLIGAGVIGMWVMVSADWLGRNILFPYEVPAGIIATLLGGAYFLIMMRKI